MHEVSPSVTQCGHWGLVWSQLRCALGSTESPISSSLPSSPTPHHDHGSESGEHDQRTGQYEPPRKFLSAHFKRHQQRENHGSPSNTVFIILLAPLVPPLAFMDRVPTPLLHPPTRRDAASTIIWVTIDYPYEEKRFDRTDDDAGYALSACNTPDRRSRLG
jgi:hypothetical protein